MPPIATIGGTRRAGRGWGPGPLMGYLTSSRLRRRGNGVARGTPATPAGRPATHALRGPPLRSLRHRRGDPARVAAEARPPRRPPAHPPPVRDPLAPAAGAEHGHLPPGRPGGRVLPGLV